MRILRHARWPHTNGDPVCPYCGWLKCVVYRCRPIFKCRDCGRQFSVTSGTIFHSRKMTAAQVLFFVGRFVTNAKGAPAIGLAREAGHDPGTAFVFAHKLREAMGAETAGQILTGDVEIDGCYIGKYQKPANHIENRVDRRRHSSPNKKCVGVLRQRGGRVLVKVVKKETDLVPFVVDRVDRDATIFADEAMGWDILNETFLMYRINHKVCYSDGVASTNGAESVHSRMRRMEEGIYHHISGRYAQLYAEENGWRENNCRLGDAERFVRLLHLALSHPSSSRFRGYFQKKGVRADG